MSAEPLGADFKIASDRYKFEKYSDVTLLVRVSAGVTTVYNTYDFVGRILITQANNTGSSPVVTPFAQLDRESLAFMHAQLLNLDGKPPALPPHEEEKARPSLPKPRPAQ